MNSSLVLAAAVAFSIFLGFGALVLVRRSRRARAPVVEDLRPLPNATLPPSLGAYLQTHDADGRLRTFPLIHPNSLIGRAEHADIRIDESFPNWDTVSREHARFDFDGHRLVVQDNNSLNGIKVNGRRTGRNILKHGWCLEVGAVALTYHAPNEEGSP